jgi:cobalt-zinc-cadmium resistance protein CzcA
VGSLGDVGFAPRLRRGAATKDGEGEVAVGVALMLMGENSRIVTERVKERVAQLAKTLPEGVSIEPYYDRSELVDRTIRTASTNLAEGALLVVLVLFLVLGHLRAGLVVATAIPLAMLAAIVGMWATRMSGNLMSLGAIDFGLIVDGAVIIIENASRRLAERAREAGRVLTRAERDDVIVTATTEVRRATIFGEAIIAIVYVPVLLLTGVEGKLFRPMAATVLLALAGAFALSLTLMPVLASLFLRVEDDREPRILVWARRGFEPPLERVRRHPWAVVAMAVALVGASVMGFTHLGAEFVPQLDEGSLLIEARRLPGTALTTSVETDLRLERALKERIAEVTSVVSRIGAPEVANDPMGVEQSDIYILLKPREQWRAGKLKADLGREVAAVIDDVTPEIAYSISQPIQMRTNELIAGIRSDVAVSFYGDDLAELRRLGERGAEVLRRVPGAADVKIEQVAGQRYLRIIPDRVRLARHGLSIEDVNVLTESLAVGHEVGQVFEGQKRFSLVVRHASAAGEDLQGIGALTLKAPGGRLVPLADVADIRTEQGPAQISRQYGSRKITVEANVRGRDTVSFVEEASARLDAVKMPPGYHVGWGGQYQHYREARNRLIVAVPAALALILFLLYLAFGELVPALVIFLNVPFAVTGGVAALAIRGLPFSISAGVGFIALFGVAVLNGVVLLSVAHQLESEGTDPAEAAFDAARRRLRPVLMTALVAILGFVPMALSTAPGSEVQRPLATVVIGGLLSSTILTLFVLPTVYGLVRRRKHAERASAQHRAG